MHPSSLFPSQEPVTNYRQPTWSGLQAKWQPFAFVSENHFYFNNISYSFLSMVDIHGDTALRHISRTQAAHLKLLLLPATFLTVVYKPHAQCSQTRFPCAAGCMKNHSKWQRDDSYSFQSVLRRTVKCEGLYIFSGRMNRGHAASEGCLNHLTRLNKSPSIWRKNARSPRSPESLSFSRHAVTHLSGFLSYLIGWRVSLSGLAYNSPYC